MVETADEPLPALNGRVHILGLLGGNKLEFHDHISLVDVISVGAVRQKCNGFPFIRLT